jgi:hypothetical protein
LSRTLGAQAIRRLSAEEGRYTALGHPRVKDLDVTPVFTQGQKHMHDTMNGVFDIQTDGLSDLKAALVKERILAPGVRKITIDIRMDDMPDELTDVHKP